jgi:RsiW-degrading membrane proteinase PrsW (M82 family)
MVTFADLVPSLRIAVDLKTELFHDAAKAWAMNAVYDIKALSMAVPYCHVVCDAEMAHFLARAKTAQRHDTTVLPKFADLPAALPALVETAQAASGERTGWRWAGSR